MSPAIAARRLGLALALAAAALPAPPAAADEHVDLTTTLVGQRRAGGAGSLAVVSPDLDAGFALGDHVALDLGYQVDVVSGATASVFAVDAVSSATRFEDTRHRGRLALGFHGRRSSLAFGAAAGAERDTTSMVLTTTGRITLPGRNTDLALTYGHRLDQVCDRDNGTATALDRRALSGLDPCEKTVLFGNDLPGVTVWRDLRIDSTTATLGHALTPNTAVQLVLYGEILRGFQSNPYRRVRLRELLPQENLPDLRSRLALTANLNRHVARLRGALHLSARGYGDSWGVSSGALELGYTRVFGPQLLMRLGARYYQQTAAAFFRDAYFYQTLGQSADYFTGDGALAPLRHVTLGGKLSYRKVRGERPVWGAFDQLRLQLRGDLLLQQRLATTADGPNPADVDQQFLDGGRLIDGVSLQLGLELRY